MKRLIDWLWLVLLMTIVLIPVQGAPNKGLQRVQNRQGQEVQLYGESHALVIGVSDYTAGWPDLESVPAEVERVVQALQARGFTPELVLNPDSRQLSDAFKDFIDRYGYEEQNRLLFFFSGHGHTRANGAKGYLVPTDAPDPHQNRQRFLRKALPMDQILAWARRIEAKHALFLFDSCFSGTVFKAKALPKQPPHIERATALPVRQFITAGSAGEEVPAQSVFTPAFLDALNYGWGDMNGDGYITGMELGLYLQSKVPEHTDQTPQFGKIRDYPLSRGDFVFQVERPEPPESASSQPIVTEPVAPKPQVVALLNTCAVHLQANRLMKGRGGNAVACYEDVLQQDPTNSAALEGLDRVAKRYVTLVEKTLKQGQRDKAQVYLQRLEQVNPEHPQLAALQTALQGAVVPSPFSPSVSQPAPASGSTPKPGQVFRDTLSDGTRGPEIVVIPAGSFMMGSPAGEKGRSDDERQHRVPIKQAFAMGKYEVTFAEYDRFAEATGREKPEDWGWGRGQRPVINVDWHDAVAYAEWLSQETGQHYRLPTEAEWEYAARAGTQTVYWWGDDIGHNKANCWGCGSQWDSKQTAPVGSFKANPWGLYDTVGNVREWTCSVYEGNYSGTEQNCARDAGSIRVFRGGSWRNSPRFVRAALRLHFAPAGRGNDLGFRLVRK